jgi:hypothetical protein
VDQKCNHDHRICCKSKEENYWSELTKQDTSFRSHAKKKAFGCKAECLLASTNKLIITWI